MYLLYDLHQLWATGRTAYVGGNAYDTDQINQQLQLLGFPYLEQSGGTFYPPWAFWLLMAIGSLPFNAVEWIWSLVSLLIAAWCCRESLRLARMHFICRHSLSLPAQWIVFTSFLPLLKTLLWGQPAIIALLGLTLFLSCISRRVSPWLAGMALSLTLVKPHLFVPLYTFVVVRGVLERNVRSSVGLGLGFLLQLGVSTALYPQAFEHGAIRFAQVVSGEAPFLIQTTTGHLVYLLSGSKFLVLFSPLVSLLCGVSFAVRRSETLWSALALLLAVGAVFTPYAWAHDQIVLLLPFIALSSGSALSAAKTTALVVIQCVASWALFAALGVPGEVFLVWLPLAIIVLLLMRRDLLSCR